MAACLHVRSGTIVPGLAPLNSTKLWFFAKSELMAGCLRAWEPTSAIRGSPSGCLSAVSWQADYKPSHKCLNKITQPAR
jgi:hypothetical protein